MKKELWRRIAGYHFENLAAPHLLDHLAAIFGGPNPCTHAFAVKVAKKRGWSMALAVRAIREYKKFVFLGIVSPTHVTPPKIIDEVWHQHIQFTRAYREFCDDVLRAPFEHNPELAPFEEQTGMFVAQYHATLAAYEFEFGHPPPPEIWGRPKFDPGKAPAGAFAPAKNSNSDAYSGDREPLCNQIGGDLAGGEGGDGFDGEGGSFGGGGASGFFGDVAGDGAGGDGAGGDGGGCSGGCGG